MKVEIWSDVVCPFCYIGKRKFEQALHEFTGKDQVEITWRSFQLDPDMQYVPGQSVHEYLGRRKGGTTADGKRMNDSMAGIAQEVGLKFNFDEAIINNTLDAHRVLHLAKTKGLQNEMKERLFAAYYTEGRNIGDASTLIELGEEIGLTGEEVRNTLQTDAYRQEVMLDQYEAQQVGVRGVPYYVFNDKYALSGAQPADIFKQVLDKVWEEEKPVAALAGESGFCTPDGICN